MEEFSYLCHMKKFLTLILLFMAICVQAQVARPKLVVGLVVDQMRWDYLYYYYNEYGEGGLKRLLSEGYSCENCQINYAPAITALGHTSVFTGSVPSIHGIAGNWFYIDDKGTENCQDTTVYTIGGEKSRAGQRSPHLMRTSTIGDELRLSNDYQSRVVGVALKDRAAILPAGHSANAAYWWDDAAGHFVTSSYYMDALPKWAADFNKQHHTAPKYNIKTSTEGVTMTFLMAEAALKGERLGQGDATDMLTVSISSTDAIGHKFSTRGKENHDVYMQLDKDLASFLQTLDATVGKGNYLFFLTADHGGVNNATFLQDQRIPAGIWNKKGLVEELNQILKAKFNTDKDLVKTIMNYQVFFNTDIIEELGLDYAAIKQAVVDRLKKDKDVHYAFDMEKTSTESIPEELKFRAINGYNRERSGGVQIVLKPGHYEYYSSKGTTHGAWNPYDIHIPCMFMGWGIQHGESAQPHYMTDIAATVCAMLHIQAPNGCIGTPIF